MTTDLERAVEAARRLLTGVIDNEGDDTNRVARALLDLMEWREIGEARKDGTRVLGYFPNLEPGYHDTAFVERLGIWASRDYPVQPTHYLPLPPPPVERKKDA